MSSIDKLSRVQSTDLNGGDLLALFSSLIGNDCALPLSAFVTWLQTQLTPAGAYETQYAAPNATGFAVAINPTNQGGSVYLLLTPAAGYAAGTITLPLQAYCSDEQEVLVSCTQAVTTLTVSGNGSTVNGAPTTLAANGFFRLRFDGVLKAWYRIG
jgi:hypothetical protein